MHYFKTKIFLKNSPTVAQRNRWGTKMFSRDLLWHSMGLIVRYTVRPSV